MGNRDRGRSALISSFVRLRRHQKKEGTCRIRLRILHFASPLLHDSGGQKLRKRKSLALLSTVSRIAGSGSIRAISTAPIIVEKIAKKARSLSVVRRPGMNGTIRFL